MSRVAITGMGMLNSLGDGVACVWNRLLAGDNGVRRIASFDASLYRAKVAAEIPLFLGGDKLDSHTYAAPLDAAAGVETAGVRRSARVFLECARQAFQQSGLAESGFDRDQAGVTVGYSVAFLDTELTREYYRHRRDGGREVDIEAFGHRQPPVHFTRRIGDVAAALPARVLGLRGPATVCDTACAASGHAVADAFRAIRAGRAKVMVAGGATAVVSPIGILYFALLGALSRNEDPASASRPFDRDRDGFVMGEGGGAVVLEDFDHARARGATILAELAGVGVNTCAVNLTDPTADGRIEAEAIRMALASARLDPSDIGYLAAHGTSTPKNDRTEAKAISHIFGRAPELLVSSNKGQLGHTLSGAAITNLVCAVQTIREGIVAPTMNLRELDPEVELDCVPNAPRRASVSAALVNSFAFGGHNAVLAVRAAA